MHAPATIPRHRFTVDEVMRMVEAGILDEDAPIELIEGELVEMAPQGPYHSVLCGNIRKRLDRLFGDDFDVREDKPLAGDPDSLPEPDVAVVVGAAKDYRERHPTGAQCRLVVEIALTSQALDHAKADVYARMGVPVYWLLDVKERRLFVHELPGNGTYQRVTVLADTMDADVPGTSDRLKVADLLL